MEQRLTALEVRYTHLGREVADLSQVVFEQQKLIDRLIKEMAVLRKSLDGVKSGPGDDPPPHY